MSIDPKETFSAETKRADDLVSSAEDDAMWAEMELLQENCPNKANHEAIRQSGSDDGCLECGYHAK